MSRPSKVEFIREKISQSLFGENRQAGERFLSEPQLVLKYGVSRQTVRKALKPLIDKGYLETVRGSGTFVTSKAVAKRHCQSYSVGILVTYLSDYIFPAVIRELEQVFTASGFSVQLASTGNSTFKERELLEKMLRNGVDGIVLEPTKSALPNPNTSLYRDLAARNFPLIMIHSAYPKLDIPAVCLDDEAAGRMAAEYLLEAGKLPVAAVLKSDDLQGHRRYRGILEAHRRAGLDFDDEKVFWYTTEDIGNFSELKDTVCRRLRGAGSAVCYNDQTALVLEEMLLEEGLLIPEDFALVSIDNSKLAELAPVPLCSVASPVRRIGKTAAEQLLRLIHGERFEAGLCFEPELIVRDSV